MVHEADINAMYKCPKCNSKEVDLVDDNKTLICLDCGYEGPNI